MAAFIWPLPSVIDHMLFKKTRMQKKKLSYSEYLDIFVSTRNPYLAFKHQRELFLLKTCWILFFIFSPIESNCKIHCSSECIFICFLHCELSNWTSKKDLLCGNHLILLYLYVFPLVGIINVFFNYYMRKSLVTISAFIWSFPSVFRHMSKIISV